MTKDALDRHLHLFHEGNDIRAYEVMGAHFNEDKSGVYFRVWAPEAQAVHVIGDFNNWDNTAAPMIKITVGVWECFIEGIKQYDNYKYLVTDKNGCDHTKSDPYAFHAETRS